MPTLRYFRAEAGRTLYEELGPISFVGAGVAGAGEAGLAVAAGAFVCLAGKGRLKAELQTFRSHSHFPGALCSDIDQFDKPTNTVGVLAQTPTAVHSHTLLNICCI